MKPCQLCGACSWGAIKADLLLDLVTDSFAPVSVDPRTFIWGKDVALFRRCDGCGGFAALALIDDTPPRRNPAHEPMIEPPGSLDQAMEQVTRMFTAGIEQRETRTERLLRAMLDPSATEKLSPRALVRFVRTLEKELDSPTESPVMSAPEGFPDYWMWLRFADRAAFETWVACGLHDTDCPTHLEKELASQFTDWMEERRQ
jgi:hypothetical protein